MKTTRIWVDENFSKMLKKRAIEENTNMLQYTKRIAQEENLFNIFPPTEQKKKKRLSL